MQLLETVGNQVGKVIAVVAVAGIGNKLAAQAPKFAEAAVKIVKQREKAKRHRNRHGHN